MDTQLRWTQKDPHWDTVQTFKSQRQKEFRKQQETTDSSRTVSLSKIISKFLTRNFGGQKAASSTCKVLTGKNRQPKPYFQQNCPSGVRKKLRLYENVKYLCIKRHYPQSEGQTSERERCPQATHLTWAPVPNVQRTPKAHQPQSDLASNGRKTRRFRRDIQTPLAWHMERCSAPLIIREVYNRSAMSYHLTPIRTATVL